MDPYCVIKISHQELKTSACIDGGRNPHWDDHLNFILSGEDSAHISIWDKRSLRTDQLIGSVNFPLQKLFDMKHYED